MQPISYLQAIVLGLIQGIAEPFPISSLGHGVIVPSVFGWNIHQNDDYFLAFLVATHCATAIVLFFFFLDDWKRIFAGLWRSIRGRGIAPGDTDAKLGWLLVVGTVPAGILGLALEHSLRSLFASPESAALFLTLNGVLLLAFESLRRRQPTRGDGEGDSDPRIAEKMSFRQAVAIGTAQAAALIPGISRSGVTMGGGLIVGLSNEDAARFAFLLATPIIAAAGFLKLPELFGAAGDGVRGQALVGALAAALTTYLAVKFLLRFFQSNRLTPFGIYCIAAGLILSVVFAFTSPSSSSSTPPVKAAEALAGSHTAVIVLENREFGEVIGAADAPYLSHLASRGALAVNDYAITHPSLPNYLALTGGSTFGISADCTDCHASGSNLATQLSGAGVDWRAYMGAMPSPCFSGAEAGEYAKRHNPFMYYPSVATNPSLCARDVPETQLRTDLEHRQLPAFAWISPNLCEDAHSCGFGSADSYLRRVVPPLLAQLGPAGLLVITFDEGTSNASCCGNASGGRIATILLGPGVRAGTRLHRPYSQYSLLATVEDRFGVPRLRNARSASALSLTGKS